MAGTVAALGALLTLALENWKRASTAAAKARVTLAAKRGARNGRF